jgi:hypothetical protein
MASGLYNDTASLRASNAAAVVEMMVDVVSVTHPAQFVAWRATSSHTKAVSVPVDVDEDKIIKCIPFDWSKA